MPPKAKIHIDMQASVCFIWFLKLKTLKPVSKAVFELIERVIWPDVKSDMSRLGVLAASYPSVGAVTLSLTETKLTQLIL